MSSRKNRFAPALQQLDAREVPAVMINALSDGTNEVFINDLGSTSDCISVQDFGNGTVTGSDNGTLFSADKVSRVRINTEGGNDVVRYEVLGSYQRGQHTTVEAGLGSNFDPTVGQDRFDAWVHSGVTFNAGSSLSVFADGGNGADALSFSAQNVSVQEGASVTSKLVGGFDNDTITQVFVGTNNGAVDMESYGLSGNDRIDQSADFSAGSHGRTTQLVFGGDNNDEASLKVTAPTTVTLDAAALYGDNDATDTYLDNLTATQNVKVYQ